jgi:phenylacetyl-CoA:acceptor oxidoreductase subunit 2
MDTELIPAERQTLWGRLAVANFFLGGAGAGAYVVGAGLSGLERSPILSVASILGPLLVIAGFLCVAAEAGRPLRGPFVLRKLESSWMSRELWAGGAFVACAAADLVLPWIGFRILAGLAALILVLAQGFILRLARGVAAWDVPPMPVVFLTSGVLGGAGLLGIVSAVAGDWASARLGWGTAGLILLSGGSWISYLARPGDSAFRRATAPLRQGLAISGVLGIGHALPLLLLGVGFWFPEFAAGSLALSGVAILTGALHAKAALVLTASQLRPITFPHLRVRLSDSR